MRAGKRREATLWDARLPVQKKSTTFSDVLWLMKNEGFSFPPNR